MRTPQYVTSSLRALRYGNSSISMPLVPLWTWLLLYASSGASVAFCLATVAFYLGLRP
jgi:hypothetical protein